MNIFQTSKPNLDTVTCLLVKHLQVLANSQTIYTYLHGHPQYPSLLAMSDCLNELSVINNVLLIERKDYLQDDLVSLLPFVAHLQDQKGERLVLISSIQENTFIAHDEKNELLELSEATFLEHWTGIILCAESQHDSGEKGYLIKKIGYFLKKINVPIALSICSALLLNRFFDEDFDKFSTTLAIVKAVGLTISVILLIQSIDVGNPFINKLCKISAKSSCIDVLGSKAAKITPWLSWSEVGFFYFASTLAITLIYPKHLFLVAVINGLSLPYSFYSISYQYKKNSWCVFCCIIQALLWAEFGINYFGDNFRFDEFSIDNYSIEYLWVFSLCSLTPILLWGFLKPYFEKANRLPGIEKNLNRFKYNDELFNQVLISQEHFKTDDSLTQTILGNKEAEHIITMITSPFCETCIKAHAAFEDLLEDVDNIRLQIVFATDATNTDPRTAIARHITALSKLNDENSVGAALKDWYEHEPKNYETWSKRHPVVIDETIDGIIYAQKAWCELLDIQETPTLLINGYRMPQPYNIKDLHHLLKT